MIKNLFSPILSDEYFYSSASQRFNLAAILLLLGTGVDIPGFQQNALVILVVRGLMVMTALACSFVSRRLFNRTKLEILMVFASIGCVIGMAVLGTVQGRYMSVYIAGIYETVVFLVIFYPIRTNTFVMLLAVVGLLWFLVLPEILKPAISKELFISHLVGYVTYSFMAIAGNHMFFNLRKIEYQQLRSLEQEINKLDRLSLLGEVAAGISHEVRNPMTTVRGFLQLLQSKPNYSEQKEVLELMISELDRANSIIKEFLSISKGKIGEFQVHNLNSVIKNIYPLLEAHAINNNITLVLKLQNLNDFLLNEQEIRQLIINMVLNGIEAMESAGTLTIYSKMDEESIILSIQDEGKGIEPDALSKLGTPFFTTKDQGTGLGLSVCYSIAARHNAQIFVHTGSSGTTFSIRFDPIKL